MRVTFLDVKIDVVKELINLMLAGEERLERANQKKSDGCPHGDSIFCARFNGRI